MRPIRLSGFAEKFSADPDPWNTFSDRDEAHKRTAILYALGQGKRGRVLELAAGNGSNSVALAAHSLRLDATEGTTEGTELVAKALRDLPRATALRLVLPGRFPRHRYDAAVIAEILYYLEPRDFAATARRVAAALRPGGRLVLAHHRVDFPDFLQHASHIHRRFVAAMRQTWHLQPVARTSRWIVDRATRI